MKKYPLYKLLQYVKERTLEFKRCRKEIKLKSEKEATWIKEVSPFLIYKSPLQKLKIN